MAPTLFYDRPRPMHWFRTFPLRLSAFLVLAVPVLAQEGDGPNGNWSEVNLSVVDHHVIPRYGAFAAAGRELIAAAEGLCPRPDAGRVERLREAFHAAMDAWQGIQHV